MNLFEKQKQTQRHREQTHGYQRGEVVGERQIRTLELANANYYISNRYILWFLFKLCKSFAFLDNQQSPTV